jgi:hypothetical protein
MSRGLRRTATASARWSRRHTAHRRSTTPVAETMPSLRKLGVYEGPNSVAGGIGKSSMAERDGCGARCAGVPHWLRSSAISASSSYHRHARWPRYLTSAPHCMRGQIGLSIRSIQSTRGLSRFGRPMHRTSGREVAGGSTRREEGHWTQFRGQLRDLGSIVEVLAGPWSEGGEG